MISVEESPEFDAEAFAAFASGRSDPMLSLFLDCVSTGRTRDAMTALAAAGAMLERETPAALSDGALERAMAAIEQSPSPAAAPSRPADVDFEAIRLPPALVSALRDAEQRRAWKPLGPGIQVLELGEGGPIRAELMRIGPGVGTPRHTHKGRELTLCLHGGFSDGRGAYGPGDIVYADRWVTHRPVADADGPCLVLALTDDGLKFTGVLGLMQKLFGG
ncbi:MAG: cupin domain-containing protein [Hyphomonadaceae bacterium]